MVVIKASSNKFFVQIGLMHIYQKWAFCALQKITFIFSLASFYEYWGSGGGREIKLFGSGSKFQILARNFPTLPKMTFEALIKSMIR